ncbi:hypothetical protein [Streptomyces sp. NPDC048473]|uniref:hypothetical protein n=1 Tax=unclassified Streptomyces TaxID=2593676 RepID=UPI003713B1C1
MSDSTMSGADLARVALQNARRWESTAAVASAYPFVLGQAGDQRPVYEYQPGRVVCVWRSSGV